MFRLNNRSRMKHEIFKSKISVWCLRVPPSRRLHSSEPGRDARGSVVTRRGIVRATQTTHHRHHHQQRRPWRRRRLFRFLPHAIRRLRRVLIHPHSIAVTKIAVTVTTIAVTVTLRLMIRYNNDNHNDNSDNNHNDNTYNHRGLRPTKNDVAQRRNSRD